MAAQPKAKNTVYSTVRPEFIYLGLEIEIEIVETEILKLNGARNQAALTD
jgi:hypothetical protein